MKCSDNRGVTSAPELLNPACSKGLFDLRVIGTGLTFADSLGDLAAALQGRGAGASAVVQAPPGTGKTTLVPPLLANIAAAGSSGRPRIVVTQPRRVAARSAARRLASLDGTRLGDRVGYTVRGERQTGPGTVIEFVTPGILLRRLLADPGLEGTDAVILDEVHERGLETDLLVGMLAEVRQLRGDLTLVAMSATLDAPRFAALLGEVPPESGELPDGGATAGHDGGGAAPVVGCPSALHPLEIQWAPAAAPRLDARGVTRTFLDHVADTAAEAHAAALAVGEDIDALVFVPGAREVSHVAAMVHECDVGLVRREIVEHFAPERFGHRVEGRDVGRGRHPRDFSSLDVSSK